MIDQIKQAMRMWKAGNTHGEIKEVTELSSEVELAATEIASKCNLTAQQVYVKIPLVKPGMTWAEVEAVYDPWKSPKGDGIEKCQSRR